MQVGQFDLVASGMKRRTALAILRASRIDDPAVAWVEEKSGFGWLGQSFFVIRGPAESVLRVRERLALLADVEDGVD